MRLQTLVACLALSPAFASAQEKSVFTHADTLKGSNGPARSWWHAAFYDLHVVFEPRDSSISGYNGIDYVVLHAPPGAHEMQIDLQEPLVPDSMLQDGRRLTFRHDGNALFVALAGPERVGARRTVRVYYHGKPRVAQHPPWDGGVAWSKDSLGRPWVATADEGIGASVWWPNKDWLGDEPDSQRIAVTVPDSLTDVSNGRLRAYVHNDNHTGTWEWFVADPINNYDVAVNAGSYVHLADLYQGEDGALTLDYWPLAYHAAAAERQFQQVRSMLACFEHWFGPYPWYRDGYKLVETPHLGMEHQSGIAYGNKYQNGYLGRDLSGTGVGLAWDFIIVHESAHEWWGNNITDIDAADRWVHEGFANYAEGLYTECQQGKEAGARYIIGNRRNVRNDAPIIGRYGVANEGSGDMYYKAGNMLHTIRQIVNDDEKWRSILRGLNSTFWHQTVTGRQVEEYLSRQAGVDLTRVFEQYLDTTKIPVLEVKLQGNSLAYRWANVVPGFDMPVRVTLSDSTFGFIRPTGQWQTTTVHLSSAGAFAVDPNFYVAAKPVG